MAASGKVSSQIAGKLADGFISTSPKKELTQAFERSGGKGKPKFAQVNICFEKSRDKAKDIMVKNWPNSALPNPLNTELRLPRDYMSVSRALSKEQIIENTPLGDDPEAIIESIQKYQQAGFDNIYLHNIGPNQKEFIQFFKEKVMPYFKIYYQTKKIRKEDEAYSPIYQQRAVAHTVRRKKVIF